MLKGSGNSLRRGTGKISSRSIESLQNDPISETYRLGPLRSSNRVNSILEELDLSSTVAGVAHAPKS